MLSINTNYGAMVALQSLNSTATQLQEVQNRISTGLKVNGPKDNGAIFAIAQGMRADVQGFNSVNNSLNRGISVVDTGLAAGQAVSEIAEELCLSVKTVSTYRSRVLEKLALSTNSDLTYYALKNGLLQ